MRAIWYEQQGRARDVLTLGEVDEPAPGPGEVAVFVRFSGVNPSDVKQRAGARGPMSAPRQIPHSDGAGVIKAVGAGVNPARIGERVWLYNAAFKRPGGACAEVCVLPAECAPPLPDAISFEAGAALGIPAITAHRALFCAGPVKGRRVLVSGGAGAVGNAAIQLARHAGAAQIIATVSGPQKAEAALQAGADEVIDYRLQDAAGAVLATTGGAGVDHIVESELGANLELDAAVIAEHGAIGAYGSEAQPAPRLDFYALMFRSASLHAVFMYRLRPEQRAAAVADISRALEEGALAPRIDSVFELEDCARAHERVESGARIGAVLVRA